MHWASVRQRFSIYFSLCVTCVDQPRLLPTKKSAFINLKSRILVDLKVEVDDTSTCVICSVVLATHFSISRLRIKVDLIVGRMASTVAQIFVF